MSRADPAFSKTILSKPPEFEIADTRPVSIKNPADIPTIESEVRGYVRSFPTVFNKAQGSILTDTNGKDYIDFFCGA